MTDPHSTPPPEQPREALTRGRVNGARPAFARADGWEGPFGYASPHYARALREFGEPLHLSGCGGWLLKRRIPSARDFDATGCYPLFACVDWPRLKEDLAALDGRLVSVTLVADPFGAHSAPLLRDCFPDLCVRYKEHYVVDFARFSFDTLSSHHRRNVRRGLREVSVEFCPDPLAHLEDWRRLYAELARRHGITGISAFSEESFRKQMRVPGLIMQRAVRGGETVGMVLWFLEDGVARYHLGAYSERGYESRASYALFWSAFEHLRERAGMAALGAGAGARPGGASGLDRFKAGWATGTRPAFLCGRISSSERYTALAELRPAAEKYFPAYRAGEFR